MDIKFSAIGISETWLNDSNCDLYNTDCYNFVETHRPVKTGGGVGIFIRNNTLFQIRNDLNIHNEFCESTFIKIDKDIFDKKKIIIIAVIDRPPGSDMKLFNEIFYESLNKIKKENSLIYLMGITISTSWIMENTVKQMNLLVCYMLAHLSHSSIALQGYKKIQLHWLIIYLATITPDYIKHFKA